MKPGKEILTEIKRRVWENEPEAKVILYGSYARGDANEESDIDLLILVEKEGLSYDYKKKITEPLFLLEIETGQIISPLVKSRKDWETRHRITPLYANIQKEGIEL